MTQRVYRFRPGFAQGRGSQKHLLGGKGANLAEMAAIGLPVPPGFTISTAACAELAAARSETLPSALASEIDAALSDVESVMGARFGDPARPLLLSVRSGAAVSMPGMMDTVLDLGMNDEVCEGLAARTKNARFAWDAYRRFLEMFSEVVMGLPRGAFHETRDAVLRDRAARDLGALDPSALRELVNRMKAVYRARTGFMFPASPREQLDRAILAVFRSWNSDRAVKYREVQQIRGLAGTAVTVQAMVFGNTGPRSGTGVVFTRNPATGARELYGEYLMDAQGEDVVAGLRTPSPIARLERELPAVHAQLVALGGALERHFRDVQDVEFTVEEGQLFVLQTRHAKRTGAAAVRIAVDLVEEGLVTREEALVHLVEPRHVDQLLHPHFADEEGYRREGRVLGHGLAASPGAAVGRVVFEASDAEAWRARGERVILCRVETSPEDVAGMHAAEGVLTSRGGMTSHAAVVARGWGKPCVAGSSDIVIDLRTRTLTNGRTTLREGDWLSLNGTTGEIVVGQVALAQATVSGALERLLGWADSARSMRVRANADTPADATLARSFGAEGVGLCRTEHMFFAPERIRAMRAMILASDEAEERAALDTLLPMQRADFVGLFRAMGGLPVTVRLLDPPLHEFLPAGDAAQAELARTLGVSAERVRARVRALAETNPMLGHRGCRLGITHPQVTAMQARALFEAASVVVKDGVDVRLEVMVPLVGSARELAHQRRLVESVAHEVLGREGVPLTFTVGTMIEVPRAALRAQEIAAEADFFSFGTNDLTQLTLGFSRDDSATFLPRYLALGLLDDDPFQTLDVDGVGALVRLGAERGRSARPGLHLGVCGEHGGDPRSIAFFAELGLDYVSCSPFRVPVARLAAAQAVLRRRVGEVQGEA